MLNNIPEQQSFPTCKSIFMSSDGTFDKQRFTQKWIELINQLERSKMIYDKNK